MTKTRQAKDGLGTRGPVTKVHNIAYISLACIDETPLQNEINKNRQKGGGDHDFLTTNPSPAASEWEINTNFRMASL